MISKFDRLQEIATSNKKRKKLLKLLNGKNSDKIYVLIRIYDEIDQVLGFFKKFKLAKKFIKLCFENITFEKSENSPQTHLSKWYEYGSVKLEFVETYEIEYADPVRFGKRYYELRKYTLNSLHKDLSKTIKFNFKAQEILLLEKQRFLNLLLRRSEQILNFPTFPTIDEYKQFITNADSKLKST